MSEQTDPFKETILSQKTTLSRRKLLSAAGAGFLGITLASLPGATTLANGNTTEEANENSIVKKYRSSDLYLNVKDFGAKGDGIADDTYAIQQAIDYISQSSAIPGDQNSAYRYGGRVFFPSGVYRITDTIYVNAYVTLQGSGMYSFMVNQLDETTPCTTIMYDPMDAERPAIHVVGFVRTTGERYTSNEHIVRADIDGGKVSKPYNALIKDLNVVTAAAGAIGIKMSGAIGSKLENVNVKNFDVGVHARIVWHPKFINLNIIANQTAFYGYDIKGAKLESVYHTTNEGTGTACEIVYGDDVTVDTCIFEKSLHGFKADRSEGIIVINPYLEKIARNSFIIRQVGTMKVLGGSVFNTSSNSALVATEYIANASFEYLETVRSSRIQRIIGTMTHPHSTKLHFKGMEKMETDTNIPPEAEIIWDHRQSGVKAMTNVSEPVNLDADTVTTAELADIVGNLIQKLRDHGIVGD